MERTQVFRMLAAACEACGIDTVDVLIHATGIAEYDELTLRDYAAKDGLSQKGFRKQVIAMQRRLNLPRRSMEHRDAN